MNQFLPEGWIEVPVGAHRLLVDAREVVAMRYHTYTYSGLSRDTMPGETTHYVELTFAGAGAVTAVVEDEDGYKNLCHRIWGAGA